MSIARLDMTLDNAVAHPTQALSSKLPQGISRMTPPNSVFVSQFGMQHAQHLALALHEGGMLKAFWSGVPVCADDSEIPAWLPRYYKERMRRVAIPRALRRHPSRFQMLWRIGKSLPLPFSRDDFFHRMHHAFDRWVAPQVRAIRPKVVVAYENAALETFRVAKAMGATCILDASSLHHAAREQLMDIPRTPYTDAIYRQKHEEVALADLILTCSPLAARSYIDNGAPQEKVFSLLLGAELPPNNPPLFTAREKPRFVFAGSISYGKSIDLILEAFRRLHAEQIPFELHFVGGVHDPELLEQVMALPGASYQPSVPHAQIYQVLAAADCLLLPSRLDSFGMVVAEAMACGTPALVSTQTGAKAIIEQYPGSGWIVEPDAQALYAQVRALALSAPQLRAARAHALQAAQSFTWTSYRQRVRDLFTQHVMA